MKAAQWCPILCNPLDYTVHGVIQARILEWVAGPFSRGSSQPRDRTQVSRVAGGFFTSWATREALIYNSIFILDEKRVVQFFYGLEPGGAEVKASACNVGDLRSIPRSERSPGEGNDNPFQYSCLEHSMYRGAWWATVHGSQSRTRLSDFHSLTHIVNKLYFKF